MPWVQQFSARCRIFVWGIYEEPSLGFNPVIPDRKALITDWLAHSALRVRLQRESAQVNARCELNAGSNAARILAIRASHILSSESAGPALDQTPKQGIAIAQHDAAGNPPLGTVTEEQGAQDLNRYQHDEKVRDSGH
jgi:hypothetical protein